MYMGANERLETFSSADAIEIEKRQIDTYTYVE